MLQQVQAHSADLPPNIKRPLKKLAHIRLLFNNILLLFIQYSGLHISTLSSNAAPVFFATGTACAFLFLRGYRVLPGIYLGNFLGYLPPHHHAGYALTCSAILSMQAVALLQIHYHYKNPTLIFYRLSTYVWFIASTALLTAMTSLVFLFLNACYMPHPYNIPIAWVYLWLGNLNAIVIFSCAYVTWDAYSLRSTPIPSSHRWLRNILYIVLIATNTALAWSTAPIITGALSLTSFLIITWMSIYCYWEGTIAACCLSAMLLSFAAFLGAPIFNTANTPMTIVCVQILLLIQTIIAISMTLRQKKR